MFRDGMRGKTNIKMGRRPLWKTSSTMSHCNNKDINAKRQEKQNADVFIISHGSWELLAEWHAAISSSFGVLQCETVCGGDSNILIFPTCGCHHLQAGEEEAAATKEGGQVRKPWQRWYLQNGVQEQGGQPLCSFFKIKQPDFDGWHSASWNSKVKLICLFLKLKVLEKMRLHFFSAICEWIFFWEVIQKPPVNYQKMQVVFAAIFDLNYSFFSLQNIWTAPKLFHFSHVTMDICTFYLPHSLPFAFLLSFHPQNSHRQSSPIVLPSLHSSQNAFILPWL